MKFSNCKILVIGDVIIDTYHKGTVDRISPEAPVPVVNVKKTFSTLGGAANVANNITHLNAEATIIGLVGDDSNKNHLEELCKLNKISHRFMATDHPTITKTRILGNHQQIVRLDFEEKFLIDSKTMGSLIADIIDIMPAFDIIVLSDYNKGLITFDLCKAIIANAKELGKRVIIDPKKNHWGMYSGAYMVTPNFKEFTEIIDKPIENSDHDIEIFGQKLLDSLGIEFLLITRSEKGMSLVSKDQCIHFPTVAKDVYDVSGAGDTVIATIAASIAAGESIEECVRLANKAAGIVVGKEGTSPINYDELF